MLNATKAIMFLAVFAGWCIAPGCAKYEHLLVEPAELAQTITPEGIAVARDPLEYRMREYDRRLLVRVNNLSDQPITLLGERSYVVDPNGESHPMRGATIAPESFIDFTLPPAVHAYGGWPRFGFGIGVGTRFSHSSLGQWRHPYDDWPYYRHGYGTIWLWRWTTGEVRLRLMYEHAGENLEHHFVFLRQRVE